MKKYFIFIPVILAVILLTVLLSACSLLVVGNGQVVTAEAALYKELTGIISNGSFEVIIDPALQGKAALEGESNILEFVEAKQNAQGILEISTKPGVSLSPSQPVKVTIPAVRGGTITINGSGNIAYTGENPLKGDQFNITINGSGNINLRLETENVSVAINGSGSITLAGRATQGVMEIMGSGEFKGKEFAVNTAQISITGSGNAVVTVSSEFNARITGSGDITYYGDPSKLAINVSGSGDVVKGE
ncbi:MAG: head GIN domain-containing protein [Bacillota bacterium]|nr:head GIN domain-containing protein [Bacillota bacterium]